MPDNQLLADELDVKAYIDSELIRAWKERMREAFEEDESILSGDGRIPGIIAGVPTQND